MMTEPTPDDEGPERPDSYAGRLFLTVLLVALYLAGHTVGLPWLHLEIVPAVMPQMTLLALGMGPLVVGFLLVEVFSLITRPGRRLRAGGTAGRARLNRAALVTSFVVSAVQSMGIALFLESQSSGVQSVVDEPGWLFRFLLVATLTAVTAAVFVLGSALSEYGIGNGFALLILADIGWSVWWTGAAGRAELADDSLPAAIGIFVIAGLVAVLVRYVRSTEATWTPPFPQGIAPIAWTLAILNFSWLLWGLGNRFQFGNFDLGYIAATLVGIPLLSWVTFGLFSSRPRLMADLGGATEVVDRVENVLERRLNPSAALLAVATTALLAWNAWQPHSTLTSPFTFPEIVLVVIIVLDLLDQYRFLQRHGPAERLVQLDNVHLSYRLAEKLHAEGIDCLARAQRLRSLYFFFGALIKIDMIVPTEQSDRARDVLAELETDPRVTVF
jgi:SecY